MTVSNAAGNAGRHSAPNIMNEMQKNMVEQEQYCFVHVQPCSSTYACTYNYANCFNEVQVT